MVPRKKAAMASKLPVASGLYNYARLAANSTTYAKRMNRLSNHIFGEVVRPTSKPSMRVVKMFSEKPLDLRPDITDHYPRHNETYILMMTLRKYGLFRDEHQDFKEEMVRLRILRGKGKPKKGEGKRAKK
ncbi:28S ribosomal protein S33, mitochondrial [Portunus trituberculatus]|uniref:Small ribosomal subunit protein mS33 n=2 Tax=Portunus trituberculatus TaxID=210409 RepID=A0A5B7ESM9_PORTR|nr:28S ribosomal protein S33, mitochondrial [Portunus trituberculatus]